MSASELARAILLQDQTEGPYLQFVSEDYLAGLLEAALAEGDGG